MKREIFCIYALALVFVGCSTGIDPEISMKPPVYVEELPAKEMGLNQNNPGSLFGRGDNPLFSDRKAMNVNDIVTILIEESTNQTSQANRQTAKDSSISLAGGTFANHENTILKGALNEVNKIGGITFGAGGANSYSGSGSNSRNENFTTSISARIVKILNNGNYFIEGSKELLLNNEKQIIQVSGVIRPYDISQNNEIESKYIADAKILYKTEGDIQRSTKKPWGTSLLEAIWPF